MGSARASSNLVVVASFLQLQLGTGCTPVAVQGNKEKRKKSKSGLDLVRVAQWIARLPPKEKVVGSNPTSDSSFLFFFWIGAPSWKKQKGVENQGIDPCASCMQSRRSTI